VSVKIRNAAARAALVLYVRFVSENEAKAKQDQWKEFFT